MDSKLLKQKWSDEPDFQGECAHAESQGKQRNKDSCWRSYNCRIISPKEKNLTDLRFCDGQRLEKKDI
jgi:hypothetical protein